jgi:hypothetical protein
VRLLEESAVFENSSRDSASISKTLSPPLLSCSRHPTQPKTKTQLQTAYDEQFTPTTRPVIVPLNDFILQELLYAYQNPSKISSEHEWINWVFRLRQPDRRHALEFVEGWNGTRIAVAGSIPLVVSTMVAIVWSAKGSGVQDGFAVAGFILTAGSCEFFGMKLNGNC